MHLFMIWIYCNEKIKGKWDKDDKLRSYERRENSKIYLWKRCWKLQKLILFELRTCQHFFGENFFPVDFRRPISNFRRPTENYVVCTTSTLACQASFIILPLINISMAIFYSKVILNSKLWTISRFFSECTCLRRLLKRTRNTCFGMVWVIIKKKNLITSFQKNIFLAILIVWAIYFSFHFI